MMVRTADGNQHEAVVRTRPGTDGELRDSLIVDGEEFTFDSVNNYRLDGLGIDVEAAVQDLVDDGLIV